MGALQLGHSCHEGALGHVALDGGHERLLIGGMQWLGKLDRLQCGQAAPHAVDDGHALCLSGGQTCAGQAEVSRASHLRGLSSETQPLRDTTPPSQSLRLEGRSAGTHLVALKSLSPGL